VATYPEDLRVTNARSFLSGNADDLLLARRLLSQLVSLVDDYSATEPDPDVSQVLAPDGAVYIAPADVRRLPACLIDSLKP
jgi:hypothetical protein